MFFPCRKRFFFLLGGHKVDFIALCGTNKSIFWPPGRKKNSRCRISLNKKIYNKRISILSQVRIAEGDNTAQYWPNIGSQESAIVIGPVWLFASAKCWADDGGLFRLFKFTDIQPKLGLVSALYQADFHFYYGIQFWK